MFFQAITEVIKETMDRRATGKEIAISPKRVNKEPWMTKGLFKSSLKKYRPYKQYQQKPSNRVTRLRYRYYRNINKKLKQKAKKKCHYHDKLTMYKNDIKKTWTLN